VNDKSHQVRLYRKPQTTLLCFFWTVRILCCDDTTTRALFSLFQVSRFSSYLTFCLHTFIPLSALWERRTEALQASNTGSLAGGKIASSGRSRIGFPNTRLGQDEHAKKAGTDRKGSIGAIEGASFTWWSKNGFDERHICQALNGMTGRWTRRKRDQCKDTVIQLRYKPTTTTLKPSLSVPNIKRHKAANWPEFVLALCRPEDQTCRASASGPPQSRVCGSHTLVAARPIYLRLSRSRTNPIISPSAVQSSTSLLLLETLGDTGSTAAPRRLTSSDL
jgi:hypothetical protein